MPSQAPSYLVVVVDRWFLLGVIGLAIMAISATGEFLGWWEQFGEWSFWFGAMLTLLGFVTNATRAQGTALILGNQRIEAGIGRVEAGVGRVEANTQAIPRIEANTHETVQLLREIRDRLPSPPSS